NSLPFGSTIMTLRSFGSACVNILVSIDSKKTDLPEPVVPAIKACGNLDIGLWMTSLDVDIPKMTCVGSFAFVLTLVAIIFLLSVFQNYYIFYTTVQNYEPFHRSLYMVLLLLFRYYLL